MDLGLYGRVAIVGGASRGLGKAIALRLADEKVRLAICSRDKEAIERAAEEISHQAGSEVFAKPVDLTKEE